MKYELWGYEENIYQSEIGGPFESHPNWELVAIFTSLEKAEEYVSKSRLKTPKRKTYSGDQVFRNGSLLVNYQDCEIREYSDPIVDPTL